jgi:AraC-like DNA-binding protein|tara:strand:- start:10042 stop:11064 length:1023 start_codon:yes stop_codon:yes gene_type:complete
MSGGITELKDSGILLQLAHRAMLELGLDIPLIFERCGVKDELLEDRNARTPHDAQNLFWQVLEDVSGDPDIGLHIAEKMPVYKGQVLQYLFLSSQTFGDGLTRALNYQRLLSDATLATFEMIDGEASIQISSSSMTVIDLRHLSEAVAYGLVKFFSYVTDGEFTLNRIHFSHSQRGDDSEHKRLYGCDVVFGQPDNRLFFNAEILEIPSLHAEPELLQLHEKLASEHVAKLERQDVVARVNRIIGEILETGQINLEQVAAKLEIKPRTLRTRLAEANTNFNQLLADFRCNLAKRLLANTSESIDEIVYLTGFSEPSTFYRAFKRWTDVTPIEYRNQKKRL